MGDQLDELEKRGVGFVASVPDFCGGFTVYMSASECREFLTDEDAYAAKVHGVTKEQYLGWRGSEYSVQCAGKTKAGRRCKNFAVGGSSVTAKDWVALQGEYCSLHGGGEV